MAEARMGSVHLDPTALGRIVVPEDVCLSPDGAWLAFTRHRPGRGGSSRPEVVVVDGPGDRPRSRTLQRDSRLARWAPDGGRLVTIRRDRRGERLSVLDAATGSQKAVGPALEGIANLVWAPDGRRVAVVGAHASARSEGASEPGWLVVLDLISGAEVWQTARGEVTDAAWSPDGGRIALRVRDPDGYVAWLEVLDMRSDRDAVSNRTTIGDRASRILGMTWSPDAASLVVVGAPTFSFHPGLHLADPTSGRLEPLIEAPRPFIVDLGGWLGGDRLLVHGRERARSFLYVLDVAAGHLDQVLDLDGRAYGLSVDAAGATFSTVRETATEPPTVVVGDVDAGTWKRVPNPRRPTISLGPDARPKWGTVSSDGADVDVWVLPARGRAAHPREPESKPGGPAVLMVHGGPHDDTGDGWEAGVEQLLADNGFVVAWSNPRGSTSYGRAFTDAVIGDIGRPEIDDLLAVTEMLAGRPDVDPARIGICGYSHGGYLAAVAITQTRRYAAAVCWAPFTDLVSEWGMSDEGRGWGRWLMGGDPVQFPERYRERSPASHVAPGVPPTLLLHGERDQRCPIGQSMLFHELLQAVGTPSRLVPLPDADHDLFASPGLITRVASETLGWFAAHLRNEAAA